MKQELASAMEKPFEIDFSGGQVAYAIHVHNPSELPIALDSLGMNRPCPVLSLVGGADALNDSDMANLRSLFTEVLAPMVGALGAAVVDGGTNAGVMRLMGQARFKTNSTFPLI